MKTTFLIFVLVAVIALLWRDYKKYLVVKYSYRLFDLRDRMRQSVIDGNIEATNWLFDYIDYSISCSIKSLSTLNIWWAFLLHLKHRKDPALIEFRRTVETELHSSKLLSSYYSEYGKIITQYILKKHTITFFLSKLGAIPFVASYMAIKAITDFANISVKNLRSYPETSASACYYTSAS